MRWMSSAEDPLDVRRNRLVELRANKTIYCTADRPHSRCEHAQYKGWAADGGPSSMGEDLALADTSAGDASAKSCVEVSAGRSSHLNLPDALSMQQSVSEDQRPCVLSQVLGSRTCKHEEID